MNRRGFLGRLLASPVVVAAAPAIPALAAPAAAVAAPVASIAPAVAAAAFSYSCFSACTIVEARAFTVRDVYVENVERDEYLYEDAEDE